MDSRNCDAKKRILLKTKFLNQILNLQNKIQKCVEISGTLEYLINWALSSNNFERLPEENLRNFEIERALERINTSNYEIQSKMCIVLEQIKSSLPQLP
jgi:hypothetical protein